MLQYSFSFFLGIFSFLILTPLVRGAPSVFPFSQKNTLGSSLEELKDQSKSIKTSEELAEFDKKYKHISAFIAAVSLIEEHYIDASQVDFSALMAGALTALMKQIGDPYSSYLTQKQLEVLTSEAELEYNGVGLVLKPIDGKLRVTDVLKGSPAEPAGLQRGDDLTAVDDKKVTKDNYDDVIKLLYEKSKKEFKVEYSSPYEENPEIKKVVLKKAVSTSWSPVSSFELSEGYLFIRVSSFQQGTANKVKEVIQSYKSVKGIVLDLRDNPGGLFLEGIELARLFVESGIIVSTKGRDRNSPEETEFANKKSFITNAPLAVLINERSASSAEIAAGCFKDHKRGFLIGTTSFGKGSVQSVISLPYKLGGIKLTVATYATPNGTIIHGHGIKPDIVIKDLELKDQKDVVSESSQQRLAVLRNLIKKIDGNESNLSSSEDKVLLNWPKSYRKDPQLKAAFAYLTNIDSMKK